MLFKVKLTPQRLFIKAHKELVFQMVSAIGKGKMPGSSAISSKVISRDGNVIVAEFVTKAGKRTVTTLEEVTLYPTDRITYRHLQGPIHYVSEEFTFNEVDGDMELAYKGEFDLNIPILGWFIGRFYVKPMFDRLIKEHMEEIKEAAEARAARSHMYRRPQASPNKQ